jgi:hypothetical protein
VSPTFGFLQPASLPINYISQKSQELIRSLINYQRWAYISQIRKEHKTTDRVHATPGFEKRIHRLWSFWKRMRRCSHKRHKECIGCKVFKTITDPYSPTPYMGTFQNTTLFKFSLPVRPSACIVIHAQKQNMVLFVGRNPLLANGGILRYEPAEHVLPITRRPRRYAQLAVRLANPRRLLYIVFIKWNERLFRGDIFWWWLIFSLV